MFPLQLVYDIINQAEKYGAMYINYEYWTILIYFTLVLQYIPSSIYTINKDNKFIKAVIYGGVNKVLDTTKNGFGEILSICGLNGVYTYIRFLFTTTILLEGDSFNTSNLKNWNKYDISVLESFLANFNHLITTNYDMLLENITHRPINHLHGNYSKNKKCIFSQYNSKTEFYSKQLERIVILEKANKIVIFGLNVDNDYHIVRSIQVYLSKIDNPHIIYCYFSENDKNGFLEKFYKCITYSQELNIKVNNIKISLISSQEIINRIFIKK